MKAQQKTTTEIELIYIKDILRDISRHLSNISEQLNHDYITNSVDRLRETLENCIGHYAEPIQVAVNQCYGHDNPISIITEKKEVLTDEQREMRREYAKQLAKNNKNE